MITPIMAVAEQATPTVIPMTDTSFLMALRLSDSFLPVGTYTSSYGVEQYINEGRIETSDDLGALIEAYLQRLVGPAEIVALGNAHTATANGDLNGVLAADRRLHAATLPAEFRSSSTKAGNKLLELLGETDEELFADTELDETAGAYAEAVETDDTPGHYTVVLGVVAQRAGIDRQEACLISAYSFVTGLLGAAQRLSRFGHTDIQSQLADLLPVIEGVCGEYADADLASLASFAPLAETMGMTHERADRRLFMS